MNIAIILAGGTGTRVGAEQPKQFVKVLGKPVLAYTIEAFQNHQAIDAIEIVCVESHIDYLEKIIKEYAFSKVKWIVKGGKEFQHSVINGVTNLAGKVEANDIVLIHYGASPFVSDDIIEDGIKVCKEKGNCTSVTPCFLLLGLNDDGMKSTKWVDRDKIMQLNSPQCFKFEYVNQLYREAIEKNILDKVEPHTTSLMYLMKRDIYFSKGNQTNIKITTKEDLDLFEGYVLMKQRKKQVTSSS
jgi:4-diphosphocytidyl-2-methyl-D-erithritol synthase